MVLSPLHPAHGWEQDSQALTLRGQWKWPQCLAQELPCQLSMDRLGPQSQSREGLERPQGRTA